VAVQADGKVLVGGVFTSYNGTAGQNNLIRLNADGTRDASFTTGTGFNTRVTTVAVQADGQVLAGGWFSSYNGVSQNRLIRLNADGTPDAAFNANTRFPSLPVYSVAVQADGKLLVGGNFASYGGDATKNLLVRLNADGTRDGTFANGPGFNINLVGGVVGNFVACVAVRADGKVLAGGNFTSYDGATSQNFFVRLNADGTRNATPTAVAGASFSFAPGNTTTNPLVTGTTGSYTATASLNGETAAASNAVVLVACPPPAVSSFTPASGLAGTSVTLTGTDLDVVTGVRFGTGILTTNFVAQSATSLTVRVPVVAATGAITLTNNLGAAAPTATAFTYVPRRNLAATLSPAGPLDVCQPRTPTATASSPAFATGAGFDNDAYSVAVQADGKVLVGGRFASYNGATGQNRLIRLNANGSPDAGFATGTGFNNGVTSVAVQADGQVLAGGFFASYNGTTANSLLRLNADGSPDAGFNTGAGLDNGVHTVAVQADGQVLAGGRFSSYDGTAGQNRLIRLNADGSLNATTTAVAGASFSFAPGNTTTNPLVTGTTGSYTATASLNGETSAASNAVVLTACPVPVISSFAPVSGPVGTSVTITGTNLSFVSSVSFNGTAQTTITATTATSLTVAVPAGATTGSMTVTTAGGTSAASSQSVTVPLPLPVTLTSFQAVLHNAHDAVLRWTTASETRSAYFAVERSADGRTFAEIGRVAAAGSSTQARAYELANPQPLTGVTYFRLRQVDLDQTTAYSPVVTLSPAYKEAVQVNLFPNPTVGHGPVQLALRGLAGRPVTVTVRDLLGRALLTQHLVPDGYQAVAPLLGSPDLPSGVYMVTASDGSQTWTSRWSRVP